MQNQFTILLSGATPYLTTEQAKELAKLRPNGPMLDAEVWAIPSYHQKFGGDCFKVRVLVPDEAGEYAINPSDPDEVAFCWECFAPGGGSGFLFLGRLGSIVLPIK